MKENLVRVTPIFGHGWFRNNAPFADVPPPFDLRVIGQLSVDESFQIIYGKVTSSGHLLDREHILLTHRGQWSKGHAYELFSQRSEYDLQKLDLKHKPPEAETIGFAMIAEEELSVLTGAA